MKDFEHRINKFRQQLILRLLDSLRDQVQIQYKEQAEQAEQATLRQNWIMKHLKYSTEIQDELIGRVERLIQVAQASTVEPRNIFLPPEEAQKSTQLRFLQSLSFEEIGERRGRIPKAFQRTFEWIFQDPDPDSICKWSSYVNWLENGEGLYWITGKPGCGKSTLMKFLENDERTKQHLYNWSGNHQLITAGFYFWNSGTELQMSIPGLLRSLLYLILKEHPDLIPLLCPERWEELNLFRNAEPRLWTTVELQRVLLRLSKDQFSHLRLFYLIDGLDEFTGDHGDLIELVRDLANCNHIKVCVASRPSVVFQEVFNKRPNFMLQFLTVKDIEIFVRSTFDENERFGLMKSRNNQQAERFLTSIMERSDGMFLWVRLVTKSLLRGISSGDKMSDLQKRLDELPGDLEGLFEKILDNIEPRYWEHATQLFQIHGKCPSISALQMSFADEESEQLYNDGNPVPLTLGTLAERYDEIKQRIESRTMGLLELNQHTKYTTQDYNSKESVGIDKHIWERIVQASPAYDPYLSLCKAMVMEAKTWDPSRTLSKHFCSFVQLALIYASVASNHSHKTLIPVLDSLDNIVWKRYKSDFQWTHLDPAPGRKRSCLLLPWALQLDLDFWVKQLLDRGHPAESREGFKSYLLFTMEPKTFVDVDAHRLTAASSYTGAVSNGRRPLRRRCLELLIKRGALVGRRHNEEPVLKYFCFELAQSCSDWNESHKIEFNNWVDIALILKEHGFDISLLSRIIPASKFDMMRNKFGSDWMRLQTAMITEDQPLPYISTSPRLFRLHKLKKRRVKYRESR